MCSLQDSLRARLPGAAPTPPQDGRRRSAVAMLIRSDRGGEQLFFVERAPHDRDPWSGNLAFPGGKVEEADRDPRRAAERETLEETGIDLRTAHYLGFLTEIVGTHLPVRVCCFIYHLPGPPPPLNLSDEIADGFWVPLQTLCEPERQITAQVTFAGSQHLVPAIRLQHPEKPVLWGITYRLLQEFLRVAATCPEEADTPQGGERCS